MPRNHDLPGHSHAPHGHHHHHHEEVHGGPGHNHASARAPLQWQRPHQTEGPELEIEEDLDRVEAAFVEGFFTAPDPTSFLRLAGIPFEVVAAGESLKLLRVEIGALTDVGSLTPHLGGDSFRYDPLPAALVSRRKRLSFIYFDGKNLRKCSFAETRNLQDPAFTMKD
jgi:hypothetical protein